MKFALFYKLDPICKQVIKNFGDSVFDKFTVRDGDEVDDSYYWQIEGSYKGIEDFLGRIYVSKTGARMEIHLWGDEVIEKLRPRRTSILFYEHREVEIPSIEQLQSTMENELKSIQDSLAKSYRHKK